MAIIIDNIAPLNLRDTLLCGQAFRWVENSDGSFTGVVQGRIATVSLLDGCRLMVSEISGKYEPLEKSYWENYFAADIDYAALQEVYSKNKTLAKCVSHAPGIRVLRQDFFETLITFIISQNNNIPRIQGIVERLAENFGDKVGSDDFGVMRYSFPSAERLAALSLQDLSILRAGYRDKAILDGARQVAEGVLVDGELSRLSTLEARAKLLKVHGVGPKVADCVLLFGLGRFEVFPVDVWIRRAMAMLFPKGLPKNANSTAGIAQQYIFHYARNSIK